MLQQFSLAVGLVVPTQDAQFTAFWLRLFSKPECGATALQGLGYWAPTHELETVQYVFTCCATAQEGKEILVHAWPVIRKWAKDTGQNTVALIRNGMLVTVNRTEYDTYQV